MDVIRNFPLFTIVLSLFSGVLCLVLSGRTARNYTIAYESVLTVLAGCVLGHVLRTGQQFTYSMGEFPAPWGNEIRAGVLEAMLALLFLVILLCSILAGTHFLKKDIDESKQNLYFSLINLMTAALMSLIWTNDIFTGYVFLEILTLTSCGILIVREIGRTTLAAVRYMILNLVGSGLFLLGVALLYDLSGHLLMVPMRESLATLAADPASIPAISLSVGILTIGLGIKSGMFPFHFWMPDTYGWATPSSGAILSSLVSKAYLFLLFKIYLRSIGLGVLRQTPLLKILFVLGICGMISGSISAIRASTINQMVAFSSAAQIGYIYMGIGLGTTAGFSAAIFQIFAHAVTKSLLFLTTPYLAEVSGESLKFQPLQGSGHRDPLAGVFFTIGSLSMVSVPIFAGFAAKLMFGQAAIMTESPKKILIIMIALALSSLLNALYFVRTLIRIYSDQVKNTPENAEPWKNEPENSGMDQAEPGIPGPENNEPGKRKPGSGIRHGLGRGRGGYIAAGTILTVCNITLGMFSWYFSDLIYRGLGMFI